MKLYNTTTGVGSFNEGYTNNNGYPSDIYYNISGDPLLVDGDGDDEDDGDGDGHGYGKGHGYGYCYDYGYG